MTTSRFAQPSLTPAITRTHLAAASFGDGDPLAAELPARLRMLALVTLIAFAAIGSLAVLALVAFASPATTTVVLAVLGGVVALISGKVLIMLRHRRDAACLQRIAISFVVAVGIAMAYAEVWLLPASGQVRWGVSGIGIWIVLFPLLYPFGRRTTLLAALLCASAVPTWYVLSGSWGATRLSADALISWLLPLYFCVGLAVLAAASLQRYRRAYGAARQELREMGRYTLIRRLGEGGMGEVWLARHRLLPREAAVKLIAPPAEASPETRRKLARQFEAEAAAIAQLTSLHTITLYDFGVTQQGEWFYVMELLDGIDLQQAIESFGPLPDWRVARILAQTCRSLAEAHQRGLVHRDIKPGNLMLCRLGDESDVIKVVDFGLVAALQGEPSAHEDDSAPGCDGTPGYLAPEVLLGTQPPQATADLYALGCVAWWLLTGAVIFPHQPSAELECVRHCTDPLPNTLREQGHDPELVELIYELLAKRPEDRPRDATSVRRRLLALACWQRHDDTQVTAWWQRCRHQFPSGSYAAL